MKCFQVFFGVSVSVAALPISDVKKSTAIMLSSEAIPEGATALWAVNFSHVGRGDTESRTRTCLFRAFGEGAALPPKGINKNKTERYNSTFICGYFIKPWCQYYSMISSYIKYFSTDISAVLVRKYSLTPHTPPPAHTPTKNRAAGRVHFLGILVRHRSTSISIPN